MVVSNALVLSPVTLKHFSKHQQDADGNRLKVPHMGWSPVNQADPSHPLWQDINDSSRFYFVHSYYCPCGESGHGGRAQ